MSTLPGNSVDMVLCDPPYGTTACKWDTIIPLDKMWDELKRITKSNSPIIMMSAQPFTSALVMSNPKMFRYDLVWEKTTASGHLNAKKMPLRAHETMLIFYEKSPYYNPIKTKGHVRKTAINVDRSKKESECYGSQKGVTSYDSTERYPRFVIKTSTDKQKSKLHPTQKPVELMTYLVQTYSRKGDVVLDFTMGSGTTGVSCVRTGRHFIGIESDTGYFTTACERIEQEMME